MLDLTAKTLIFSSLFTCLIAQSRLMILLASERNKIKFFDKRSFIVIFFSERTEGNATQLMF